MLANGTSTTPATSESFAHLCWHLAQRIAALVLLILCLPLLAILYVVVRATSKGPFLYRQSRPGMHGATFSIHKIRTMSLGADRDPANAIATLLSNPQITRVGRWLRDLKVDELPQLWNVVRGDMVLVGPRPIAKGLHDHLCKQIPGFERRLTVRPGLTNLGQICVEENGDSARVVEDWRLRFDAELHYIRERSVSYDVLILAMTFLFVIRKTVVRAFMRSAPQATLPPVKGSARRVTVLLTLLASVGLSGCGSIGTSRSTVDDGTTGQAVAVETEAIAVPSADAGHPELDYLVGPGDLLAINVFGDEDMSDLNVRIDAKGLVQIPLIEEVTVGGMSVRQVRDVLKKQFEKHLNKPWITVQVKDYRSQPIYLLGQVNQPGVVYLDRPTNLVQALAHGRGLTANADLRSARLIRDGRVLAVDIYRLLKQGDVTQNIWLKPNDCIHIPDNSDRRLFVLGEVQRPGMLSMGAEPMDVLQAITAAGGLRDRTPDLKSIRIIRSLSPTRGELLAIDLDSVLQGRGRLVQLQPGDVVIVPQTGLEDWNDIINALTPTFQLLSGSLEPFVQIKFLKE